VSGLSTKETYTLLGVDGPGHPIGKYHDVEDSRVTSKPSTPSKKTEDELPQAYQDHKSGEADIALA